MLYKDFKLKFSNGITLTGMKMMKCDGLRYVEADIKTTDNANGVGELVTGYNISSRDIDIEYNIEKQSEDTYMKAFKPMQMLTMTVGGRFAKVTVKSIEITQSRLKGLKTLKLKLFAPNPYFSSTDDFGKNIAGVVGMFGFPWMATVSDGITVGYKLFTERTVFSNDGDNPVGLKAVFKAKGECSNVKLENLVTGEYILVNTSLVANDVLEISTIDGDKHVTLNGVSIFGSVDHTSVFFSLAVGDNYLSFDATGETNLDVYLYYRKSYLNGLVID